MSKQIKNFLFGAVVGGLIVMSVYNEHMVIPILIWAGGYVVFITLIRFLESLIEEENRKSNKAVENK